MVDSKHCQNGGRDRSKLARKKKEDITWKKYMDVDEALFRAKTMIGDNYYTEPLAQEYIQKITRKTKN